MTYPPVVITYAYGMANAGDHALTQGAIEALRPFMQLDDIGVISRFPSRSEPFDALTDIERVFSPVVALSSPFAFSRRTWLTRFFERIYGMALVLFVLAVPGLALRLLRGNEALQALAHAKLILCNGGNLLYWNKARRSLPRLVALMFPLLLARRLGIPYGFLPQTMGPFDGWVPRLLFRRTLENAEFVLFRESISLGHAEGIADLKDGQVGVVPDLAFFEPAANAQNSAGAVPDKFIAVTLRATRLGDPENSTGQDYDPQLLKVVTDQMSDLIEYMSRSTGHAIKIVVQTKIDRQVSQVVLERLESHEVERVTVIEEGDPVRLSDLYERAEVLVGMRLHSLIFGLRRGTPCLGPYLEHFGPKTPGVLTQFGLGDYALELNARSQVELREAFDHLYARRDEVRKQLLSGVSDALAHEREFLSRAISDHVEPGGTRC